MTKQHNVLFLIAAVTIFVSHPLSTTAQFDVPFTTRSQKAIHAFSHASRPWAPNHTVKSNATLKHIKLPILVNEDGSEKPVYSDDPMYGDIVTCGLYRISFRCCYSLDY